MERHPSYDKWNSLVWKRPAEVYGEGNFCLFDKIGPDDIKQGYCGDCYFLASLSSLAEFPERIKKIFLTKEVNEAGCYAMQFYICGEKRTVVVDDKFPYNQDYDKWAFSKPSRSSEIWVLLLEKAWAKCFGSYQRIEAGSTGEALHPLSGCPAEVFLHDERRNKEKFWELISFADSKKFPMCTSVASQGEVESGLTRKDIKNVNLVDAHAYSLITTKVIDLDNGQKERLIKIRNPYGKKEWNGDWSDKSDKWTESTRKQVNLVDANDGTFWISFKDYDLFFYVTTICFYRDDYSDNYIQDMHSPDEFGMVSLKHSGKRTDPVVLSLDQVNARYADETMSGYYQYAPVRLMMNRVVSTKDAKTGVETKELKFVDGCFHQGATSNVVFKKGLPAGDYVVTYQAAWDESHSMRKVIVSFYADDETEMKRVNTQNYDEGNFWGLDAALQERLYDKEQDVEF